MIHALRPNRKNHFNRGFFTRAKNFRPRVVCKRNSATPVADTASRILGDFFEKTVKPHLLGADKNFRATPEIVTPLLARIIFPVSPTSLGMEWEPPTPAPETNGVDEFLEIPTFERMCEIQSNRPFFDLGNELEAIRFTDLFLRFAVEGLTNQTYTSDGFRSEALLCLVRPDLPRKFGTNGKYKTGGLLAGILFGTNSEDEDRIKAKGEVTFLEGLRFRQYETAWNAHCVGLAETIEDLLTFRFEALQKN